MHSWPLASLSPGLSLQVTLLLSLCAPLLPPVSVLLCFCYLSFSPCHPPPLCSTPICTPFQLCLSLGLSLSPLSPSKWWALMKIKYTDICLSAFISPSLSPNHSIPLSLDHSIPFSHRLSLPPFWVPSILTPPTSCSLGVLWATRTLESSSIRHPSLPYTGGSQHKGLVPHRVQRGFHCPGLLFCQVPRVWDELQFHIGV